MKRIAVRSLIIIALLAAALCAAAAWVLNTSTGLQLVWQRVEALVGPGLATGRIEGTLAGPLVVKGFRFENDAITFTAETMAFDWNPLHLLKGTLLIEFIEGNGVRYVPRPASAADAPAVLPERISFPLRVRLGRFHLDDIELLLEEDAESLAIDAVTFSGSLSGGRLALADMVLEGGGLSLTGEAGILLAEQYPLHANVDLHARYADYAPVSASTRVSGNLHEVAVMQRVNSPYAVEASVVLKDPLGKLHIDADVKTRSSDLAAINTAWPAMQVTASLAARGPAGRLQLGGTVSTVSTEFGPLEAVIESELQPGSLLVQALHLTGPDGLPDIRSQGRIGFGTTPLSLDMTADWQHLAWPPVGEPVVQSRKGNLVLRGTPGAYTAEAQGDLEVPSYFAGQLSLTGAGDAQSFSIPELEASAYDGSLHGSADLTWTEGFQADIDLQGETLNPGVIWPDWPARLNVQLETRFAVAEKGWSIQFSRLSSDGVLRDYPLQVEGRGAYQGDELRIENLSLQSGTSRARIQGRLGKALNLEWEHHDLQLALFSPGASGRVSGKGEVQGTPDALQLTATLAGKDLRYQLDRIDTFDLDARLDTGGEQSSRVVLALGRGELGGVAFRAGRLQLTGYPRQHVLTLEASADGGTASVAAAGAWDGTAWTYNLEQADLAYPGLAPWKLLQPVSGRLSRTEARVSRTCWSSNEARLCLNGAWSDKGLNAAFQLDNVPFGYFSRRLPTTADIDGSFTARGTVAQPQGRRVRLRVELDTTVGNIAVTDEQDKPDILLAFDPGHAVLNVDGDEAVLDGRLPLASGRGELQLRVRSQSGRGPWAAARLDGNLLANLPDISFAGRLIPDVSGLQGRIDGTVDISGTVAAPRLQGQLALTQGALTLDTPGVVLSDVGIRLTGQRSGEISIEAKARSGKGALDISGSARPFGVEPAAEMQIRGEHFQIVNTPEAQIDASPDLQIALAGQRIDVSGTVEVPHAAIQPRRLPKSAVTVSADQIIAEDQAPQQAAGRYRIYTRVRLILGKDVRFDGLGLKGQLGGNVLATGEPGRSTSATGELRISDGKYRAYGQDLDVRTGRLLFAGGVVTEPGLDIEAERRPAADILVGVKVRGTLRAPDFSLFSDPAMSQSEQLSWLVLGRSLESGASASERSALNEAALMLGLSGGEAIGKELAQSFGIDEISVSSEPGAATTQASLLVGKYLTPELFVSYGIGIFEPVSTLKLRYTLTSRWKLVGEASALRSAADLFYVIEKGD